MRENGEQRRIDTEAAEWLIRKSERPLTPAEETAFVAWRKQGPRHDEAFAAVSRVRKDATNLRHLSYLLAGMRRADDKAKWTGGVRFRARGAAWSALGGFAAVAAALVVMISSPIEQTLSGSSHYETSVGESRSLQLEDGTILTLGARSKVKVAYTPTERRVSLIEGEAFFDVVHNPDRAFVVEAGDTVIRDVGTKFDVNRAGPDVRVAVLEGAVEVQATAVATTEKPPTIVHAGQRIVAVRSNAVGTRKPPAALVPVHVTLAAVDGSWREGRLVYENATLAELAADMNRYYAPGVRVSPAIADIRVTASFRTNEVASFLPSLATTLPVLVVRDADGTFRMIARENSQRAHASFR